MDILSVSDTPASSAMPDMLGLRYPVKCKNLDLLFHGLFRYRLSRLVYASMHTLLSIRGFILWRLFFQLVVHLGPVAGVPRNLALQALLNFGC